MHPLVQLAKDAVDAYLVEGRTISPPPNLPPEARQQAGSFVSIKSGDGALRGCIGTIEPTRPTLAHEVIDNAILSASADPRFAPLTLNELPTLAYSVDVLSPPQLVFTLADLDPQRYGLIVQNGARRGVLLPDLDGVNTVAQQLAIALAKAAILPGEPVELLRFQVQRYT